MRRKIIVKILRDIGISDELIENDEIYKILEDNVTYMMGVYRDELVERQKNNDYGKYAEFLKNENIKLKFLEGEDFPYLELKMQFFENMDLKEYEGFLKFLKTEQKTKFSDDRTITIRVKNGKVFININDDFDHTKDRYVIGKLKDSDDIGVGRQILLSAQDKSRKNKKTLSYGQRNLCIQSRWKFKI